MALVSDGALTKSLWIAKEATFGTTPAAASYHIRANPVPLPDSGDELVDFGIMGTGKPYQYAQHVSKGILQGRFSIDGPLNAAVVQYHLVPLLQSVGTLVVGTKYTFAGTYTAAQITRAASVGALLDQPGTPEWVAILGAVPTSFTMRAGRPQGDNKCTFQSEWLGRKRIQVAGPTAPTADALAPWTTMADVVVDFTTPALTGELLQEFSLTIVNNANLVYTNTALGGKHMLGVLEATGEIVACYGGAGGGAEMGRDLLAQWDTFATNLVATVTFGATTNLSVITLRMAASGPPRFESGNSYRSVRFPFRCLGDGTNPGFSIDVDNGVAPTWAALA